MRQLTPSELQHWLQQARAGACAPPLLLDVREPWELAYCALSDAIAIPLGEITVRRSELDPDAAIVVLCHHGVRSARAGLYLETQGFAHISNLAGGLAAWSAQVDPTLPTY